MNYSGFFFMNSDIRFNKEMSDEKDIIKQLVNDPQVQPESDIDIWESIFNDKWYTTDIFEEKIARLHQDFEINGTT